MLEQNSAWTIDAPLDLTLEHVAEARQVIPAVFLDTPQFEDELLNAALGHHVTVKLETGNPLRCFKGRGVSFALRAVGEQDTVVCSSSGNFGQAVAFVGRSRGATVQVYVPTSVNPVKRERMLTFGAKVIEVDGGIQEARRAAASAATAANALLLVDGVQPGIAEGAATIAQELSRSHAFDTLVAPIGDGSLISGLALWTRAHSPGTRIIGVTPESAPAMRESLREGEPVMVVPANGFAEGISIPRPHPESLARISRLVDDIVLVSDDDLSKAMWLVADRLSTLAEPAGAAGIAAIASGQVGGDTVATIVTGANPNPRTSDIARQPEWAR